MTDTTIGSDSVLTRLAVAQQNLKGWEKVVADLKAELTDAVAAGTITLEDNKIVSDGYQFICASRTTWTYPPSVLTLESALKQQQQLSQLNGTATAKTLQFWTLKPQEP